MWEGNVSTKDGALQLGLILDYIGTWARDRYRPSIIGLLDSIATGTPYENVPLDEDVDIASTWKRKQSWNLAPTTINDEDENAGDIQNTLPELPETKRGTIRRVTSASFQLSGLFITEHNLGSLLHLSGATMYHQRLDPTAALKLVAKIVDSPETVLITTRQHLRLVERLWTGTSRDETDGPGDDPTTGFYTKFEYRCFIDSSWNIVRELSYLAITEAAFSQLARHCQPSPSLQSEVDALVGRAQRCSDTAITNAIKCLRAGSRWQILVSAISSRLLTLSPLRARRKKSHRRLLGLRFWPLTTLPRCRSGFSWRVISNLQSKIYRLL